MILAFALLSLILLAQAPGAGWVMAPAPPREVRRVYWELVETTEVWVRLTPGDPNGAPPLVSLVFQAFFPGRPPREPYSLLPQWPKGVPARLVVRVESFPLTATRDLSLRLELDGYTFNLTGPGSRYSTLPCGDDCAPSGIEVELDPPLLRALIVARTVRGEALGFPIQLVPADQRALSDFAERVGLSATTAATQSPLTNSDRAGRLQPALAPTNDSRIAPTSGDVLHRQPIVRLAPTIEESSHRRAKIDCADRRQ